MKNNVLKSLMVMGAVLSVVGCGGGSTLNEEEVTVNVVPVAVALATPTSVDIVTEPTLITLDGTTSSDADVGDTLTYAWTLTAPTGSSAVLLDATLESPTFIVDVVGNYEVILVVNDGTVDSNAATVTIVVTDSTQPVNATPVAVALATPTSVDIATESTLITLDGSTSTDADSDPITAYTWSLTPPLGSSAVLSSTTGVSPTFIVDIIGSYVASLVVSDGSDNSVATTVTITVTDSGEPLSILSQDLKESIAHMYNEEGLAYDVYMNVYKIQAVQQLQNIAMNSEIKHIEEVNTLAIKYDLNITDYPDLPAPYSVEGIGDGNYSVEAINILYDFLYTKGIQSKQDALEMGCMVEVVDIDDLDKYIALAEESNATDVLDAFNILINGSYKHYQQFDQGLKDMGIAEGCCIVPAALGYDSFCNDEYLLK